MTKKQRRKPRQQNRAWLKLSASFIILIALLLFFLSRPGPAGQSYLGLALNGTFTPTPTSTPTPTLTPTPTNTPTPTPSPTPMPLPQLTSPLSTTQVITNSSPAAPVYSYEVINSYPHDPRAYIQGLVFEDGVLYEGTGRRGQSTLRKVDLETGQLLQMIDLPPELFGEGIVIYGDRIIQLTWQARVGFVYDKATFQPLRTFEYPTEGWGITHDGQRLIMSDGTATLYFWDPETLEEIGRIEVLDNGRPVTRLNELEFIQGEVYANVWKTDRIARIDPETGRVVGWVDLTGLLGPEDRPEPEAVLNGIAYDPEQDRLFVTGKLWSKLFEIALVAPE